MKLSSLILIVGILLLMAGCAASSATDREPLVATSLPEMPGGALATVAPAKMEEARETAVPPTSIQSSPSPETPSTSVTTSEAVAPVSVDLSKITPVPPANTDPLEMPQPGIPGQADNILSRVQQDLSTRLGKDLGDILVVSMEEVEWPDSALGCPAGDFAYMTVITPGFQIILSVAGTEYDYHTNARGDFVLCVDGRPAQE